jgi:ankyrin repeat protein
MQTAFELDKTTNNIDKELIEACEADDFERVKLILRQNPDFVAKRVRRNIDGRGPLHYTARNGDLETSRYLIEVRQIEVDFKDDNGETAFVYAAKNGHLRLCKFLLEKGANLNVRNKYGFTPLMYTVIYGHFNVCNLLIENGADINATDEDNNTALLYAAMYNLRHVAQFLIQMGADMDVRNLSGSTALMFICARGHLDLVKQFCFVGAQLIPTPNDIVFSEGTQNEKQTAIINYLTLQPVRQVVITVLSASIVRRLGDDSLIKMLNIDLIRKLYLFLTGIDC